MVYSWVQLINRTMHRNWNYFLIMNCSCTILLLASQMLLAIQYVLCLQAIQMRFHLLNHYSMLEINVTQVTNVSTKANEENAAVTTVIRWARLHDELINAVRIINKCYAFPIIIKFAADFSYLLVNLFEMYRRFKSDAMDSHSIILICTCWSLFFVYQIVLIILMGQWTSDEVRCNFFICSRNY